MTDLTQKQAILIDLKNGFSITPIDALKEHGCFRLAAVVCQLRKDGWDIKTEMVAQKGSGGNSYASYRLKKIT